MFLIDKDQNRIHKIKEKTFSELGFKERTHLQEWIANNPESLGEDLLIIQKEFAGFNDTKERLDLLALDKQGNVVVIENKLDDSGKDVTWQVIKYASYCSSLKKSHIIKIYQDFLDKIEPGRYEAEKKLSDFFEGKDIEEIPLNNGLTQRLMLIAGDFRKEVTSCVLWLLSYNIRLQCFKVVPYELGEQLFLDIEQIIPVKDAQEFTVSMAEKTQEDVNSQEELKKRHIIRKEFWQKLLKRSNERLDLFKNVSPSIYHWIGAGSGLAGVTYNYLISKSYARCEIYIDRKQKEENERIFELLYAQKASIENAFGNNLEWERLDDKRACRIKFENPEYNLFELSDWDKMIEFMVASMDKFEKSFKGPIKELNKKIKNQD